MSPRINQYNHYKDQYSRSVSPLRSPRCSSPSTPPSPSSPSSPYKRGTFMPKHSGYPLSSVETNPRTRKDQVGSSAKASKRRHTIHEVTDKPNAKILNPEPVDESSTSEDEEKYWSEHSDSDTMSDEEEEYKPLLLLGPPNSDEGQTKPNNCREIVLYDALRIKKKQRRQATVEDLRKHKLEETLETSHWNPDRPPILIGCRVFHACTIAGWIHQHARREYKNNTGILEIAKRFHGCQVVYAKNMRHCTNNRGKFRCELKTKVENHYKRGKALQSELKSLLRRYEAPFIPTKDGFETDQEIKRRLIADMFGRDCEDTEEFIDKVEKWASECRLLRGEIKAAKARCLERRGGSDLSITPD
ncbi:hypothetical protein F5Y19DRAFT_426336 [Xylariaceae sp. FL1651]|nr:hypothetical protein F5Y19DRAFT_426336 [Xylariaceae sp. FL1651]